MEQVDACVGDWAQEAHEVCGILSDTGCVVMHLPLRPTEADDEVGSG